MTVLITGGAGFIGSHCCVTFLEAGHDIVVLDNLSNANSVSLNRVSAITGRKVAFEAADIRDQARLEAVLDQYGCSAVVHFAGLKAVGESTKDPLAYYDNNVVGTQRLLSAMAKCGVRQMIFSSSATVYGEPKYLPLTEDHPTSAVNPYGRTKLMIEDMLRDIAASDPSWRFGILRYFNPVGAHDSGLIGENPLGIPNNLMPFITQVADGRRAELSVFGKDYETRDGTGIRDYIHVTDLVEGHLRAHEVLASGAAPSNCFAVNLGTGTGYSVLEMVRAFERASNKEIRYSFAPRRDGDVAECFAHTAMAEKLLNWKAERDLDAMCRDTWNWVCKNPRGYETTAA
ncbi:UDP-glucose 4-epimerase GalE [Roseibium aggregatum]|uniref:UDP-glucose 4-epimerase n=1 Tax=Roseibium aggregatum TaxID=187304 RepID=A0A939J5H5_9HYPH|nr:UDP-glucose 4-epimerase GalE [Roseibium aggregatum]MBN9672255.1 UDP-glucose 4-epimerase GalE [Roseibium aggregatum]